MEPRAEAGREVQAACGGHSRGPLVRRAEVDAG
jgi:hypothetical protein